MFFLGLLKPKIILYTQLGPLKMEKNVPEIFSIVRAVREFRSIEENQDKLVVFLIYSFKKDLLLICTEHIESFEELSPQESPIYTLDYNMMENEVCALYDYVLENKHKLQTQIKNGDTLNFEDFSNFQWDWIGDNADIFPRREGNGTSRNSVNSPIQCVEVNGNLYGYDPATQTLF